MAVDESREGLLAGQDRSSLDKAHGRVSLDTLSDLDATDYLGKDGVTTSTFTQLPSHSQRRQNIFKRRCCRIVLGVVAVLIVLFTSGGMFGWKKFMEEPPYGQSPPWYPAPRGGTLKSWADSYDKAAALVAKMTLPEKVNITTGTGWGMGPGVGNTGPALNVGFPALYLQDGPLGIRHCDNITAFPAGITVGATWSRELMYEHGKAHAIEARNKGVHAILGPAVGPLGKIPAGGRTWEAFGADPYLQGVAAATTVRGIQDQNIMATIKHFVGNEQEHFRQGWEWGTPYSVSSNIDDRAMHELYAWPFADTVKAGVASVMCAYTQVNNSYSCDNAKLMNGLLKDEMGFQGFVMSDWLAQRAGVASALAGLDMNMPGDGLVWQDGKSLWGPELSKSVLNGSVPVDRLNDMVTRIVAAWYQLGQDDEDFLPNKGPNFHSFHVGKKLGVESPLSPTEQETKEVNQFINVQENHNEIARKVAAEGTVLLKNDGTLPLSRNGAKAEGQVTRVGIYGDDAGPGEGPNFCADRGCNQGTLASGWGSGAVDFAFLVTPIEALRKSFDKDRVVLTEHLDNDLAVANGRETIKEQDVCIVFGNADAGEGFIRWGDTAGDRADLYLQKGGEGLIKAVADNCGGGQGSTIVVIHSVGPVIVEGWFDHPGVKAVLWANLPGEESGNALVSILFGDENPSGKMPYTVGKSLEDYGPGAQVLYFPNSFAPQQDFSEGLYVDYRHFDKFEVEPRFEFGYGLSYTSFAYSDIHVEEKKAKSALPAPRPDADATPPEYDNTIPPVEEALFPKEIRRLEKYVYPYIESADEVKPGDYRYPDGYDVKQPLSQAGGGEGGNPDLWTVHVTVSVKIKNTGSVAGKVVPQLYLSYPEQSEASDTIDFPVRVLRGFDKVKLDKGESKTVEFELTRRDLSYWNVVRQNWVMLEEGQYKIAVGESSRDLKLEATW